MSSRSRPRAATSVATSVVTLPLRKRSSARSRANDTATTEIYTLSLTTLSDLGGRRIILTHVLTRQQRYLDDDVRPEPWVEIVAGDVTRLDVSGIVDSARADAEGNVPIPARLSIALQRIGTTVS